MFDKLALYKYLSANGAQTPATLAVYFGDSEQAIVDMLSNDTTAFSYDGANGTFLAVAEWSEAAPVVMDSINSLAELLLLPVNNNNPDELALFLSQHGISSALAADGEYVARKMGVEGGELDQLAQKFGLDTSVPGADMYIQTLKQQFVGIAAILHAIKLQAAE